MAATGRYTTVSTVGEKVRAFIPNPLPPVPPLVLESTDQDLIDRANRALGTLDGITGFVPDSQLFIYFYVRKEALLSSQIEGTQSSFSDFLLFENEGAPGVPLDDVQEVSNYVAAMNHGLKRLRQDNFPLSLRLIREIHGVLLSKGRGSDKDPGEFRRSQNWVGGSRPGNALYIPPPPEHVAECMGQLERFLHDQPTRTPVLIKAALAHVQFETIHPFLDGNGRLGRLLIALILCEEGTLKEPLLYLSLYFKRNRQEYYRRLQRVRMQGDWNGWLRFFLTGVIETAQQATDTVTRVLQRFEEDRRQIDLQTRRNNDSTWRLHNLTKKKPLISVPTASSELGLTAPTVRSAVKNLEKMGILREITGKRRDRIYLYAPYVEILDEGTEP
jgi:cell filamentation protein, protein adenylyltransferase